MAQIGSLEFPIRAIDESSSTIDDIARKIQDMANAMASTESLTDQQMQQVAKDIQEAYAGLDTASATHRASLAGLQQTYDELGKAMGDAFRQGSAEGDEIYRKAQMQRQAVAAQIREEKKFGQEIDNTADELAKVADAFEAKAKAVKQSENAQVSLRTQMRMVVQELADQEMAARASGGETAVQALRASEAYQALQQEAGRLSDAMGDARTQMSVFANDNAGLQGVIVGLQGMTGAMSAAQGVVGMFTEDQEKLQQVMLKVQSVMAIANGMMQVANALNKDSYFTLVILNRVKQAWAETNRQALATQEAETATLTANTAATQANAAAEAEGTAAKAAGIKGWIASKTAIATDTKTKIANSIASKAASTANKGLALSFRLVSTAIKSIPVIGWVLAGVAAVASAISLITKSSREAKKEQDELKEKITEAGAESVASLTKLSAQFTALGENMGAKQRFIEDNRAEFEKLGISVQNVVDAENVLIKNKDKFIAAQIAKASASVLYDQLKEKAKELVEAEQEYYDKQTQKRKNAVEEVEEDMQRIISQISNKTAEATGLMGRYASQAINTTRDINKKAADSAADSVATINRLSVQWQALNDDVKKQREFIAANKGEFEKLGISIRNATDAENALVKNKDKFVAAMAAKAESMAYFDTAKEKYKEFVQAQLEMEQAIAAATAEGIDWYSEDNKHRAEWIAAYSKSQKAKVEADKLITMGNEAAAKAGNDLNATGAVTGDPRWKKELEERKKEYERYTKFIRSTNATLQEVATGGEFDKLLEGGATYRQYLENQIAALQQAGEKTKDYTARLRALQDELASTEQEDILTKYKTELDKQLDAAKTQQEMLEIIAENRRKLAQGGDVALNEDKATILDQSQKEIEERERQHTQQLLSQYADYLSKRVQFEADYAENSRRLSQAVADAKTEEERRVAEEALRQLQRQQQRYASSTATGDTDYDTLLSEFKTYEAKKAEIEQDYQERINIAVGHNNQQLADDLRLKMQEELGKLAAEQVRGSDAFKRLFDTGDLDQMTTREIERLIGQVNAQIALHPEIDQASAKAITDKLKDAIAEVAKRKPFESLKQEWQDFVDGIKKGDINGTVDKLGGTLGDIAGVLDTATGALSELGVLDEDSEQTLNNITGMVSGAADIAAGIASGNWLQAIQGGVQLVTSAIKEFDTSYKEMVEKTKQHEKAMERLQNTYSRLRREVEQATGQALTAAQQQLKENLDKQIAEQQKLVNELQKQYNKDEFFGNKSEKKLEEEKELLEEEREKLQGLLDQRNDLFNEIAERALGGSSINSAIDDLVSALVDAWAQGENAVEAYGKKVKDIVKSIARNIIIQSLITPQIKRYFDEVFTPDFFELGTELQTDRLRGLMNNLIEYSDTIMGMFNGMSDEMREWLSWGNEASGLSGAIQGMSQESADVLAGQTNAMRINQATMIDIMREQLIQLSGINSGVSTIAGTVASINQRLSQQTTTTAYSDRSNGMTRMSRI